MTAPARHRLPSLIWLQGLLCGALVALAPSLAMLLASFLGPVIAAALFDREPGKPRARAAFLFQYGDRHRACPHPLERERRHEHRALAGSQSHYAGPNLGCGRRGMGVGGSGPDYPPGPRDLHRSPAAEPAGGLAGTAEGGVGKFGLNPIRPARQRHVLLSYGTVQRPTSGIHGAAFLLPPRSGPARANRRL